MAGSDTDGTTPDLALGSTLADEGGPTSDLPPRLGDRYRLLRVLGHGGMGNVYLAFDEALAREVALKRVVATGDVLARLRDEVSLAQKVTHRNVCRTYDLTEIDGTWLIKMEYVAGETLAERLKQGQLPVATAVHVAREICAGLAAAHREGVVHRDLKPHNVMIEEQTGRVVLMDFGIARAAELAGKTAESVSGTPDYMAPEQARGREVDRRADLYSLGCLLYEMLTGKKVFPHANDALAAALAHAEEAPPTLPASVPDRLRRLVARSLEKDPARRPQSADEVIAGLGGRPVRRSLWVSAAALLAATAAAALIWPKNWRAEIRELPGHWEDATEPVFSPDGKSYAYCSDREEANHYRLYVAPLDGGPARAVTPRTMNAASPRWTRDGKALLFNELTDGLSLRVALDGGEPVVIAGPNATYAEDCGGRLVITYGTSPGCEQCTRFVLREADGREREVARFPAGSSIGLPRCDRAGRQLVYAYAERQRNNIPIKAYDLWLLPLDGGDQRRLTTDRASNSGALTPDGRWVVFSAVRGGHYHLYRMPAAGGPEEQLTFGADGEMAPDISPDGRSVLYAVALGSFILFQQALSGGPLRRLSPVEGLAYSALDAEPGGRSLLVEDGSVPSRPRILRVPLDGSEPERVADGQSPTSTPDEIVYYAEDQLLALPHVGGRTRLIARVPGAILHSHAGPDGRVHALVSRPGGYEAWSAPLAGGAAERELPAPWSLAWPAPKSGWRVVEQIVTFGPNRLRLLAPGMAVDDPRAKEIVGDAHAWTTDGRSFVYDLANRIHVLDVESGADRDVGEHTGPFALSSDGATIYTSRYVSRVRRELITNFAELR